MSLEQSLAHSVALAIKAATAPLLARIAELEARPVVHGKDGEKGEKGQDGKDAILPDFEALAHRAAVLVPPAKDGMNGKDAAPVDVKAIESQVTQAVSVRAEELIAVEVGKAMAAIHIPKDGINGKDADPLVMQASIDQAVAKAVAAIPPPKDGLNGTSVTLSDLEASIWMHAQKAAAALPLPKDGRSVTVEDVAPLIAAEVTKAVALIPTPKEARSITSGFLDRTGNLMLSFSDGTTTNVGLVIGKDADPVEIKRLVLEEVAKIPRPIDGKDGTPGRDGFAPDDLDFEFIPETRSFVVRLLRDGLVVKEVTKPVEGLPLWRGTYAAGKSYSRGDITTWNGGWWIAKASTTEKPGDGKTNWQLTVMRGEKGERGEEGKAGRPGKDLTQMTKDGTKF